MSAGGDSALVGAGGDGGEDSLQMQQDHYDKNGALSEVTAGGDAGEDSFQMPQDHYDKNDASSEVTAHADEQPLGDDIPKSCKKSGRYLNPWPTWSYSFLNPINALHWLLFSPNYSSVPSKQKLDVTLPISKIDNAQLCNPREDALQVTWIGHSTVLVQMEGLNILTDPIFSERVFYGGMKRYRKAPCTVEELPEVHAVVISHSHGDHLDYYSVRAINSRFGSNTWWFVPAGLRTWMESSGCENVIELEWDKESCIPDHPNVRFVFTPAQHWSTRTYFDRDKGLWGSWCILGSWQRFYFAGDTGYCAVFKQIGKKYGPFDLAAIPIGCYEPRWFMKYQHINPSDAVQIHKDLQARQSLGIHWGTFNMANEFYLEPPEKMKEALQEEDLPSDVFFTLGHGETRCIGDSCNKVD